MPAKRIACAALVMGAVLHWNSLVGFAGTMLKIQPANQTVQVGQSFSVDVRVEDVVDLMSWQFDISYDPTLLSALSVTEGPFLASGGGTPSFLPGTIDDGIGQITAIKSALASAAYVVDDAGVLVTITFQAIAAGQSLISVLDPNLRDPENDISILEEGVYDGIVDINEADVNAVPEPSTFVIWSLVAGLVGIGRLRARSKPTLTV